MSFDDEEQQRRRTIKGMKSVQAVGCGVVVLGFCVFLFLGNTFGRKWEDTVLLTSMGIIGFGVLVMAAGAAGRWLEE